MKRHALQWIVEPLSSKVGYVQKAMFGCQGCYYDGRLVIVLADQEEPWKGVLLPVERHHHESLTKEFPQLAPHPILPKWLYLSDEIDHFEETTARLVELIKTADPRLGVTPSKKRRRKSTKPLRGRPPHLT